jgi:branched-chain amino acid transport system permease protein
MNIAQQIVNGLVLGSGYACIALGWTILLGVARLVNFAHGQLYMLGAFATWYAMTRLDLPYPLAILAAIVALAVLGALMQSAMMGLVMTQNLTSLMIVTLGLGYVLQGGSALIFGGNPQTLPGTLSRAKVDLGSLWFTWQDVLVLAATLALYGAVWLFTQKTRFGSIIRAVAEDRSWPSCSVSTPRSSTSLSSCSNARRLLLVRPWSPRAHRSSPAWASTRSS